MNWLQYGISRKSQVELTQILLQWPNWLQIIPSTFTIRKRRMIVMLFLRYIKHGYAKIYVIFDVVKDMPTLGPDKSYLLETQVFIKIQENQLREHSFLLYKYIHILLSWIPSGSTLYYHKIIKSETNRLISYSPILQFWTQR